VNLSARTMQILKNFSLVNDSMMFRKGNKLVSMSPMKEMMAHATIQETIPRDFGIFNLNKLLGTISLFDNPDLEFESKFVRIRDGKQSANFFYTDESMIEQPNNKQIVLPDPVINFELTSQVYSTVQKALHVLQLPNIAFIGDGSTIKVAAVEEQKKSASNIFHVEVGETQHEFRAIIKSELMKLLPENYNVTISSKGLASFKGSDIQYWVAVDGKNSSFNM